jgi:retron-type reverse transcriptase
VANFSLEAGMRRTGGLWESVLAFDNLHRAAYQVLRGKRTRAAAGDFFRDLEDNLLRLRDELRAGTYRPGAYRAFWIADPKRRLISAAPLRDRVVHHALINMLEPVFEPRFIHHSYACRKGKGTHRALRQFTSWARTSRYVLKMDVRKFFPTIDHAILKQRIRRTIKDPHVLQLCDVIIDGSNQQESVVQHYPGDDLLTPLLRRRGVPIGNLTSQFFANVYLDPLDHFVKERLRMRCYLRYADDFCCFHDDKGVLTATRAAVIDVLLGLRQHLNEGKSRIRRVKEGIEFLGFVVFPDQLRLNRRAIRRQRRRLRRMRAAYAAGDLRWEDVSWSLLAWNAHVSQGTTWRLRGDVFRKAIFR